MRSYFNTDAGWRYFRNTWLTATLMAAAVGGACSLTPKSAFAAQVPAPTSSVTILVEVVWLTPKGELDSIELAGEAPNPGVCLAVTAKDAAEHIDDWKAQIAKGLKPHLACAIAVPDKSFLGETHKSAPSQKEDDRCYGGSPEAHLLIQGCNQVQT